MYPFRTFIVLLCSFTFLLSCTANEYDFSSSNIIVLSNGDKVSSDAANYFFNHLKKRIINPNVVRLLRTDQGSVDTGKACVYFELVPELESDYEIVNKDGRLSFFAKDKRTLNWLSYMLIDYLASYQPIDNTDLPPNYINFKSGKYYFTLEYRDPHLWSNTSTDVTALLNTHNVDVDWAVWGHNFKRFFLEDIDSTSLALVNGKRDQEQFCFSSTSTFNAVSGFILDQYGRGEASGKWFMLLPNDNDKVCTCSSCLKVGNTNANATPAVVSLLNRVASEYPNHHFFTTAYKTTKKAPFVTLESNTGVLFSTIELSKMPYLQKENVDVGVFLEELESWRKYTPELYLWDYVSNFDEYLTPFPVLFRFQQQLSFFKGYGIKGMFLNGNGYDYSPFDDVKTYVLSALMIKQDLDVESLILNYLRRFYPVTWKLIGDYYLDLEKYSYKHNLNINVYSSFKQAKESYFHIEKYEVFYNELLRQSRGLKGEEALRVNHLLDALSFVKLQIAYDIGSVDNGIFILDNRYLKLSKSYKEAEKRLKKAVDRGRINSYKEEGGDLISYLDNWYEMEHSPYTFNHINTIKVRGGESNEYYRGTQLLIDNKKGFNSDFNQGWFLIGEDAIVSFDLNDKSAADSFRRLALRFLINKKHRMLAPERVDILVNGILQQQFSAVDFIYKDNLVSLNKEIEVVENQRIEIRIVKNKQINNSVIACDEIQIF